MTRYARRLTLTLFHLLVFGVIGSAILGVLGSLLLAGIGSIFAFGVGFIILLGLVYALYGVAWFEVERVTGLYRLDVPSLALRRSTQSGFVGWLRSVGRQAIDGRMWRAIANVVIGSVLGFVALTFLQGAVRALEWVGAAIALIVIIGLAALYRTISIAIIRAGIREAELTQQVRATVEQREGAVRAADVERTRIERDLHDGVQPRLVSIGMTLGLALEKIDEHPSEAKSLVSEAHASTRAAITELRQLARGIHASVLDDHGLDAALSALAARSHIPVQLDIDIDGRCSKQAETAVYFAVAEALTNAAKHSRASECRVTVRLTDEAALNARIEDDGIGGAHTVPGGGIDGVMNRVVAAGGTFTLDSPHNGPTTLEVNVPCAS